MCHATSAGRKAGSVSTNKSQFVDTLSTNKAYQEDIRTNFYFQPCYEEVYNRNEFTSHTYGGIITPEVEKEKSPSIFLMLLICPASLTVLHVQDLLKAEEEEKKRLAKIERRKTERRCPKCDMKVTGWIIISFNLLSSIPDIISSSALDITPTAGPAKKSLQNYFPRPILRRQPRCKICGITR